METKKILECLNYKYTQEEAEKVLKINSRSSKEDKDYFMKNLYGKCGINKIAWVGMYVVVNEDGRKWFPGDILQYLEGVKCFAEVLKKNDGIITEYKIVRVDEIINGNITKITICT